MLVKKKAKKEKRIDYTIKIVFDVKNKEQADDMLDLFLLFIENNKINATPFLEKDK